jgi:hypothetical protein
MTHEEFKNIVNWRFARCQQILNQKSDRYSSNEDRLHNFKEGAKLLNTSPEKYLMSLVTKHWIALNDMMMRENLYPLSESDWKKFHDMQVDIINYMLLLEGLLND